MGDYKIISADTHIVEPPDLYTSRIDPKFRDRAPVMRRDTTAAGREYDAWFLDDLQVGTLAVLTQAGQRFKDPEKIDFLGIWEEVRKGAYDPDEMLKDLEIDGIWGGCFQPSQALFWYRLPDSQLLSALSVAYNDWIADFCKPHPERLKAIGCINVDDVDEGCRELERCAQLGMVAAFIPVYPLPDKPYRHPIYERLWWTAQDLEMPLLLHIGAIRSGIPGCEMTLKLEDLSPAGFATFDQWVRYSMTDMIFSGAFERYPKLKVGSVEHEMGFVPYWLNLMDFIYSERPTQRGTWKSKEGFLPSDYWRRNLFVEFMADDIGMKHSETIGVDNILWGNDFPHAESTWPESMRFLDRILADTPEEDRKKITSGNAARLFKFNI